MKKIRITKKELRNLDMTLADINHQYLLALKGMERHVVIFSHTYENPDFNWTEEITDDTEWFLDELIWTFETIANGYETPQLSELIEEVFGGCAMVVTEEGVLNLDNIHNHPRYAEYKQVESGIRDRIKRGLDLFSRYFSSLGD